jgi:hypothetical protein
MATTFNDREHAFEAKFALDEERKFRALARRDKLFARWAAARLGLAGGAWDGFVHDMLAVQGFPKHDTALLRFVTERFSAAGIHDSGAETALARFGEDAADQVHQGNTTPVDLTAPAAR